MVKLSKKNKKILDQLVAAQKERDAIPVEQRIPVRNQDKYDFPIGISEDEIKKTMLKKKS